MLRYLHITLIFLSFSVSAESKIDRQSGLKIAPGWQLVNSNCTLCHSAKIITMQHNSRNGWINIIRWMQDKQGLRKFEQKTEGQLLAYLTKNYPPKKRARRVNLPIDAMPNNPYATSRKKHKRYKVIVLKKKVQ